jgi:hypothetical protein
MLHMQWSYIQVLMLSTSALLAVGACAALLPPNLLKHDPKRCTCECTDTSTAATASRWYLHFELSKLCHTLFFKVL